MPKKIVALTQDDRDYLQALGDKIRHSVNNPVNRPAHYDDGGSTSEVYIARTPASTTGTGTGVETAGGIPAMTVVDGDTGTGIDLAYYPGFADCDIYTIREAVVDDETIPELVVMDNYNKAVHNLSTCAIPENTWVLLTLTKGGKWVIAEVYDTCTDTGTGSTGTTGTGSTGTDTGTGTEGELTGTNTGTDVSSTGTGTSGTEITGTGTSGTDVGLIGTGITGTDVDPTGTGTSSCVTIPGVDFDTLPISTSPDYVLGIKDGCLVRVPVGNCNATGTG